MRNIPHKPNSWPTYRASCPTFLAPPGGNQQNPSERQHCGLECGRFLGEIRSQFYVELSELYMFQVWHDWPRSNQLLALLGGVIFVERFMIPCSKFNDLSSYIIILIMGNDEIIGLVEKRQENRKTLKKLFNQHISWWKPAFPIDFPIDFPLSTLWCKKSILNHNLTSKNRGPAAVQPTKWSNKGWERKIGLELWTSSYLT